MYHYETLGDERFQELCQALISSAFPTAQCLPVGQPDGGRDAFIHRHLRLNQSSAPSARELIVFQIKYLKNSHDTREERDLILEIARREKTKIDRLRSMGLSKYFLVTNAKGTAHLGSGSIDQLNAELSSVLGIEAYCWWRDDLDRRLDGNSSVKWSYPDLLKATDLLHALIHGHLGEDEERRRAAIRAYMIAQYQDDQELKFKQTELRSTMTDLFVDLPMRRSYEIAEPDPSRSERTSIRPRFRYNPSGLLYVRDLDSSVSSAAYFTQLDARNLNRIVLEGAPGQGKSTITQYMCQVMRIYLLGLEKEISSLPKTLGIPTLRIPFRVDLRDLAKWISGTDPFSSTPVDLDEREPRSLEAFLAAQVRFVSGGHEFSVSDLAAVARASHLLLALDGFDEVADVTLRQKLVTEITKASNRLATAGEYSIRTLVTSRPAAFAKSIRFPRDDWAYFELLPLEREHVDEYTSRWTRAKGLKPGEQQSLIRILDTKLRETHTQYLSKNPMQLTILLSLIYNRGASLPEKRTAMYDAYMDMFFSRESEKSDVVRDNRDLLVDIHRFLAWKLQTSAESGENGSISSLDLRRSLLIYLHDQGEDTNVVDILFDGIIERVGALVSRLQGTYEFEVQPLREYFAARHLYETAPYSPAGDEKSGTKLDRFEALIKNPYWLNVARFYGGCFSKGEVSALVDQLEELSNTEPYRLTSHASTSALILLGDWVFSQFQPAVKRVVGLLTRPPQIRLLMSSLGRGGGAGLSLPERSGRAEFLGYLWDRVHLAQRPDERRALSNAIVQNTSIDERFLYWSELREQMAHSAWVRLGSDLRLYAGTALNLQERSLEPPETYVSCLLDNEQFSFMEERGYRDIATELVLNEPRVMSHFPDDDAGLLERIAEMFGWFQYYIALTDDSALPLALVVARRYGRDRTPVRASVQQPHVMGPAGVALEAYETFRQTPTAVLQSSILPWSEYVRSLRSVWGDRPSTDRIAFLGAGVRSKSAGGANGRLDSAEDLVGAARFVRLKSGAPSWWVDRLRSEASASERRRLLLLLWMWGTPRTIARLSGLLGEILNAMPEQEWFAFAREYNAARPDRRNSRELSNLSDDELEGARAAGPRVCAFLGYRVAASSRLILANEVSENLEHASAPEVQFALDTILSSCTNAEKWSSELDTIGRLYRAGASVLGVQADDAGMPPEVARRICGEPSDFPMALTAIADSLLRSSAGASAPRLLDVANKERWFQEELVRP